jgi:hypothetical protein
MQRLRYMTLWATVGLCDTLVPLTVPGVCFFDQ